MFLGMSFVITPPIVSIPRESGVTSRRRTSFTSPARTPPWIAAPIETASSGLIPFNGSFPKKFFTTSWNFGIREEPPIKRTSLIWSFVYPESFNAFWQGIRTLSQRLCVILSNSARVKVFCKCFGPVASAVMNGRLMSVVVWLERAIFAFSDSSLIRCIAIGSFERSIPVSALKEFTSQSEIALSQSAPPR